MAAEKPVKPRNAGKRSNTIAQDAGAKPAKAPQSSPEATKKVKSVDPSFLQAASPGAIPEALRKRYFSTTSKWSGEPAYFTTAQAKEPAFRDQGRRLITSSESEEIVRDLVAIARHRGWSHVHVTGSETFRRAAWLEASRHGLEVRGYRPNERDLQELDRVRRDASRNSIAPAVTAPASREPARGHRQADEASRQTSSEQSQEKNARAAQSQLRVIETVVRAALFDNPDAVARVMKVANDKVQTHLQAGRQFQAAKVRDMSGRAVEPSGRKRQEPGKERPPLQRSRGR
ncbi:LPD7 domain-containing protein [Sphingobium sp. EM0848]|uniref:LPD7 domain-containing protein n=1 Tax=Sphingobium sp. EM0848 TaxID=2743473 RepID=UPI00159C607D|nr:LPD7 domain-containing protein [Sphingobium sp. EM0848]